VQDGDQIVVMELDDLNSALGGITMTPVYGYAILSPNHEHARDVKRILFERYGIGFRDADKEFGSQCRLLKERGLVASFFDHEDFEKLNGYPGWLVHDFRDANAKLARISQRSR
jgi:hypothetical protein